jgi:hypothetical protein
MAKIPKVLQLPHLRHEFSVLDKAVATKFEAMDKQIAALKGMVDAQHAMIIKLEDDCDTMLLRGKRIRA